MSKIIFLYIGHLKNFNFYIPLFMKLLEHIVHNQRKRKSEIQDRRYNTERGYREVPG